jgi:hypothetical protein
MEVVFITESLFKDNSPVTDDAIIKEFIPYINIAQKMHTEKTLGKALSDELKSQIKAATENPDEVPYPITPDNKALITILAPSLSFYAVYEGLPFHWASIVNKGVTKKESENSKAVDKDDIAQLRSWAFSTAKAFEKDLVNYLNRCKDSYPLWQPDGNCGCGVSSDSGSARSTGSAGIYFHKK